MAEDSHQKLSFSELDELNKKFDRQLEELQNTEKYAEKSFSFKKTVLKLFLLLFFLVAPFIVLVRISLYMYSIFQFDGWIALALGVTATILLLIGYVLFLTFRYGKSIQINTYLTRGIVALVTAYTLYGLFYYSSLNTKTEEIRSYYRSLHPIMRVAVSTATLADGDLVITDIQREPEDYAQMGLPENKRSLHYVQSSGYVHAIDLRTRGRAEWKNLFTRITIKIIGLKSIRHVGTADHLHVYLPLNSS